MKAYAITFLVALSLLANLSRAFVPSVPSTFGFGAASTATRTTTTTTTTTFQQQQLQQQQRYLPAAFSRQRKSTSASVQTMGLFGLGAPEIAVILVAAAFLLGPQKLAELGKDAGKIAGELKEVPKEFQKGIQEGEQQAKALKKEDSSAKDADKASD